jgi:ABC-2 type transport system permease protein
MDHSPAAAIPAAVPLGPPPPAWSSSARCCTGSYAIGFTGPEGGQRFAREALGQLLRLVLQQPLGTLRRELVLKELRVFFRDSTQWSQLILLAVLVVVYVVNIRYLPLTGDGMTFFIVNIIPFLNLALSGFVLASIAARSFPAVSLEGRTWWLLRSSAMSMRDLLWQMLTGTSALILAVGIVGSRTLLQVSVRHLDRLRSR